MAAKLAPVWTVVRCRAGGASVRAHGRMFLVNARTAPQFDGRPYCRDCWDRAMALRAALGWTVYEVPEGTWPDAVTEAELMSAGGRL